MRQQGLEAKKALIYEHSGRDCEYLKHQCAEFGIAAEFASTIDQVKQLSVGHQLDVAIVNIELPKVSFAPELPVIAIGNQNRTTAINMIRYNPVVFAAKPLESSMIKLGLAKALRVPIDVENYPSALVEISGLLKEMKIHLQHLDQEPMFGKSLEEAICFYCTNFCSEAKSSEEAEIKGHEVIDILCKRGTLVCSKVQSCELRRFGQYMMVKDPLKMSQTPLEIAGKFPAEALPLLELVTRLIKEYDSAIHQLYQCKKIYCSELCDFYKEGHDFEVGDNLHATREEMLQGKVGHCKHKECVLERFFCILGRKVL